MSSGRGFPGQRISKKLMLRVRPGVELVRASFDPSSELITLDFPTLERPRNATSGRLGAGKWAASVAAARNLARTLILKFALERLCVARGRVPSAISNKGRPLEVASMLSGRGGRVVRLRSSICQFSRPLENQAKAQGTRSSDYLATTTTSDQTVGQVLERKWLRIDELKTLRM